jgi:alpha,alpha-trehalose phosphorylase
LPDLDFEASRDDYPLLLHTPYFELYRRQVIKQADLELAMYTFGHHFSDDDKARNVDYYERRTVRDSSLSASVQAVICAEVGHLELAHDYAYEAALIDLHDIHHNSRDGLHIASLAGAWVALVAGFGGLRDTDCTLRFDPQLPPDISRLCFNLRWRGLKLRVAVTASEVTYSLREGDHEAISIHHCDEELTLRPGDSVTRDIVRVAPLLPRPEQPAGREPGARPGSDRSTG